MTTMTHSTGAFAETGHPLLTRAALVVLYWGVAAFLVLTAHHALDPLSPHLAAAAKVAAIVVVAFVYVRWTTRAATIDHALMVGIVWLVLNIAVEFAVAEILGRGWFLLIGSPESPMFRDLFLFTWIAAPALFARYSSDEGDVQ